MRSERRWISVAATLAVVALSNGCSKEVQDSASPVVPTRPTISTVIPESTRGIITEGNWTSLTSQERISKLELKSYPDIPNFDPREELKLATAQFYCQVTKCNTSPEDIANNIFFVTPSRFLEEAQKDIGRKYTKEETEKELNTRPEMVNKDKQSFINIELYDKIVQELEKYNPDVVRQLGSRDFKTVLEKSLFIHIFSHMNQTEESYFFDGFSMTLPSRDGLIKVPSIDKLDGFTFEGVREDGSPFFINGANEAITERVSVIVGRKIDYISFATGYNDGALLVDMLNKKSGISDQEFLEYANGARSMDELFTRWGSVKNPSNPDKKAAILALASIGLYVDGIFSFDSAKQSLDEWLKPSSK